MSKIAEKKVRELGYFKDPFNREEFTANDIFDCGVECYDQALQDFMEKAEEFLYLQLNNGSIGCGNIERLIDDFKNYMQDEM